MTTDQRIAAAAASLREPKSSTSCFQIAPARIIRRVHDLHNARQRAARLSMVRPEHAATLATAIFDLAPGDRLHAITPGDFVFANLINQLCALAHPTLLSIATLSLSKNNVAALASALDAGHCHSIDFLISEYFAKTSPAILACMTEAASNRPWRIGTARTHAKITLLSPALVIETSANLRSSQNIEQITVLHDPALYAFHRAWLAPLMP